MGFKAFYSAKATIAGIETAHMIRKGQLSVENISAYKQFIALAGWSCLQDRNFLALAKLCDKTCLSQRIPDKEILRREVEANVRERNLKAKPVNWRFTNQDARRKLARLYPAVSS